jgi:hypothetical protein
MIYFCPECVSLMNACMRYVPMMPVSLPSESFVVAKNQLNAAVKSQLAKEIPQEIMSTKKKNWKLEAKAGDTVQDPCESSKTKRLIG